jgi:ferrous iron transport protein B
MPPVVNSGERAAQSATFTVALAGNPNSGKTTIFNALTGLRQKVANYPGITVEKKTGRCQMPRREREGEALETESCQDGGANNATFGCGTAAPGDWIEIVDLPGTYSMIPHSPDELVTMEVLRGLRPDSPAPDAIVVVVDASNLPRNLYLVSQLLELGKPLVVALNMVDVAESKNCSIDAKALANELGIEVVPVVGHKKKGIDAILKAVAVAKPAKPRSLPLPEAMWQEIHTLSAQAPGSTSETVRRLLIADEASDLRSLRADETLVKHLESAHARLKALDIEPMVADIESRFRWIDSVVERVQLRQEKPAGEKHISEKIDAVLMHRFWGLIIFGVIMAALFVSIFIIADPVMGAFSDGIAWLGTWLTSGMADGPLKDLINDGIFAGVGGVVVFVPQIALLFLFLAALEDSGYLARAAFIMDRILSKVGLHGKSFIPLLSSFACAIPGVMAARTIEGRERLATILVAPFMSCSARLPVYGLLIGAFFRAYGPLVQGLVMLGCYLLGIVVAAATAWCLKLADRRRGKSGAFILEMPTYKMPQLGQVLMQVWANTSKFLTKAGTIIFCLSILLWAMSYYPRLPADQKAQLDENAAQQAQMEYSVAGRVGHAIEPVIAPLGYDWKIGVGLIGAFAAREVFNSYLGIIYSVGDSEDTASLEEAIAKDRRPDGKPVWTPLVAVSLLIWFVIAMQCMSTVAVVKRETNGWKWPLIQLMYMNALAYVICLIVYQVGSRIWA